MTAFLNFISDFRVLIAIAVIVVVLIILLLVISIRTKRFKNELKELEAQYQIAKNIPIALKMNKAIAIGRVDGETSQKVQSAKDDFDRVQADLSKISAMLSDVENDIYAGKLRKVKNNLDQVETLISVTTSLAKTLEATLDGILAKETAQRSEVTTLKNRFRALKSQAQSLQSSLSFSWNLIEQRIADIEKMFSTFEEWMYSSDFDKANKELDHIKISMQELEMMLEQLPPLLSDARGTIPSLAENIHKDYVRHKKRGVYLNHLEVEKNISLIGETLVEDLKKLRSGQSQDVKEHLEEMKQRLNQLDESIKKESSAFDMLTVLKQKVIDLLETTKQDAEYVSDSYQKVSVRFGLEGMDETIERCTSVIRKVEERLPRVEENMKDHSIPSSTLTVTLQDLYQELNTAHEDLHTVKSRLELVSSDEDRAKKQLVKLQIIMNQMRVKMRKYKLPSISKTYDMDMAKASQYINRLEAMMKEVPLNLEVLTATLQEALDFIYKLYNNVNNVVGTVVMVENTIVFGNRYRSTYADIDSELTRSELCFRNGEYTQALTIAIAVIEKIHPGNYESMIKENAESAA